MRSKYHSVKVTSDGQLFDSKKEALRWSELRQLERAGVISDLERQVRFVLIPAQREPDTVGPKGGVKRGKLIERECAYIADFCYTICKTGTKVVEDTKGLRTPDYIIKRKLMLEKYGIRVREV